MRVLLVLVGLASGCVPGSGWDDADEPSPHTTPATLDTDPLTTDTGTTSTPDLPGYVVINEVLATALAGDASCDGATDGGDTFIELVGLRPTDLSGATLSIDGAVGHVFGTGASLSVLDGVVVFGGPGAVLDGSGSSGSWCGPLPASATVLSASTGALGLAPGATVELRNADGQRLDAFVVGDDLDASYNRSPELSPGAPVPHGDVVGAVGPFSPGTATNGDPFTGLPTETGDTGLPTTTDTDETATFPTGDTGPTGPIVTEIYAVQDGTYVAGQEVTVDGVVVTAVATDGVMVQEPAGGLYSGVFLALGVGWEVTYGALVAGDTLDVTGVIGEVDGNTVLDPALAAYPLVAGVGTAPVPAPLVTTVDAVAADSEAYEGVLVEVGQVVVTSLTGGTEIEVQDGGVAQSAIVDDRLWLYSAYGDLVVGGRLQYARGVVFGGVSGPPRLSPRSDADLAQLDLALRINEVLGDPAPLIGDANCDGVVDGIQDDFVEIWNLGGQTVDLSGMTLSDVTTTRHTFSGVVLPPGGGVVVFGGGTPTFDGSGLSGTWCAALTGSVSTAISSTGSLGITNSGDTLTLKSIALVLDTATFGPEAAGDVSVNRSPELSSLPMVRHDAIAGAANGWSPGTLANAVPAPYRATVAVDGDPSDFPVDALFSSSAGTTVHAAWDAANLYLALEHPAVAGDADQSLVVYLGNGGGVGSMVGLSIGPQQPALQFPASYAVTWAVDGSESALWTWNALAGTWGSTPNWLGTNGSSVADDDVGERVELAIPLTAVSVVTELELVLAIVDDTSGAESTVCAFPSGAITDGATDPDLSEYYLFHPQLDDPPTAYAPVP